VQEGLIYAGTDDGLIQVTEDGGENWRRIDGLPGVPDGFFVNDIKADLHDADTVYVCVDNHKAGDFAPYMLMSTDRGRSWASIAGDLPDRHLVWRMVQDHVNPGPALRRDRVRRLLHRRPRRAVDQAHRRCAEHPVP
jgi:photosystem II stability/assembly factor-like uncharacterized protein